MSYISFCPLQNGEGRFPFYNEVICLHIFNDIQFEVEKDTFSIYYQTNFLRYNDFKEKKLSIPDSLWSTTSEEPSYDLTLYYETYKNSHIFNGQSFLKIGSQKFENKASEIAETLLPSNNDAISKDEIEKLTPSGKNLCDYFLKDLNDDGFMDLVLYYSEEDCQEQTSGTIEIFKKENGTFQAVQKLPEIYITELHHLSYLKFEGFIPIIFVGGLNYGRGYIDAEYYFFIATGEPSARLSDFSQCESFIKQEFYKLNKD